MALGTFLAEQVRLAHRGEPWHGASLADNLGGLSADAAAARPVPGAHSIWELVLHAAAWAGEARRRLEGGSPSEPVEGDWPPVTHVSEQAWTAARERLAEVHEALAAAIERFPESRWAERIGTDRDLPLGTGVSYAAMVAGLLQHDGYHGGQIALLRRALDRGSD